MRESNRRLPEYIAAKGESRVLLSASEVFEPKSLSVVDGRRFEVIAQEIVHWSTPQKSLKPPQQHAAVPTQKRQKKNLRNLKNIAGCLPRCRRYRVNPPCSNQECDVAVTWIRLVNHAARAPRGSHEKRIVRMRVWAHWRAVVYLNGSYDTQVVIAHGCQDADPCQDADSCPEIAVNDLVRISAHIACVHGN